MMREKSSSPRPFSSARLRERGFALVVVLVVILMLTVLVVGLLVMAENETKSAARYMDAADARLAADSVVQIVQGQIKAATLSGIDGVGKGSHAWASQPGAIRVYDDAGGLVNIYKLYSSPTQVVSVVDTLFDGSDLPGDWATRPDEFVDLNAPVSRGNQWIFPIASPEALGVVAGFTSTISNDAGTPWDDRLVMPVRWLYVQKDGSMNVDPSVGAPILRIAYWTDDESSKININTASATRPASYADIPRANYKNERDLIARMQPSQNEFNRYPGHPATVNLGAVFPASNVQSIIEASARYEWGGSKDATIPITSASTSSNRVQLNAEKKDRLFVSPDEYLYKPNREKEALLSAAILDQRRFFLSSTSRSPDLNLFGQPRVTIWPISAEDNIGHRTPYDQLIASCSTIGKNTYARSYYFSRKDALSQTNDWANQPRNRAVFSFLRDQTTRNIPGFGGAFQTKYDVADNGVAGERDQILTEIFDYIRCSNLNETYRDQPPSFSSYTTNVTGQLTESTQRANRGAGFVLPIEISDYGTRGAGRVPVISEVGLWFIQTKDENVVTNPDGSKTISYVAPVQPEVQTGLLVETFSPMQGFMPWVPHNFSFRVRNIVAPTIRDAGGSQRNLFPDASTTTTNHGPGGAMSGSHGVGGIDGWGWLWAGGFQNGPAMGFNLGAAASALRNPFFPRKSDAVPVSGQIEITGGEIEIEFLCDKNWNNEGTRSGDVFQTYRISIPSGNFPIPAPADPVVSVSAPAAQTAGLDGWYSRKNAAGNTHPIFFPEDVVHSIELRDGDFRTLAYLQDVPSAFFLRNSAFGSPVNFAHGFRGESNHAFLGTRNGSYLNVVYGGDAEATIWDSYRPKIRPSIVDLQTEGWEGDFDTGIANLADGPYLNKSDEGMLSNSASLEPYFWKLWWRGSGVFSPLKQLPSPVVFGSLPTGVKRTAAAYAAGNPSRAEPWRTLNFCPNPLSGSGHFGITDPKDFLLLDLFRMPVVEPYAITESFSTAGQLNMNYQIMPFTNIKRKTALFATLSSQQIIALKDGYASDYKSSTQSSSGVPTRDTRYPINAFEVIEQFDDRFDTKRDLFHSATEICSIFLVPDVAGVTAANVEGWWNDKRLTGNNLRERPYATLYPLLTTKSNVFTTHIRVQAIKRLPDGKIAVNSEYRGAVTFERFLDPNDPVFTDGSVNPDDVSLEPYFRFRTLVAKQFDP